MIRKTDLQTARRIILAFLDKAQTAQQAVHTLIEQDCPLVRVLMLARTGASDDDPAEKMSG
jgi:hypothetical protein